MLPLPQEAVWLLSQHRLVHHDPGPGAVRGDRGLRDGQRQLLQVRAAALGGRGGTKDSGPCRRPRSFGGFMMGIQGTDTPGHQALGPPLEQAVH